MKDELGAKICCLLDEEPEASDVRAIGGAGLLKLQGADEASAIGELDQGHQLVPEPGSSLGSWRMCLCRSSDGAIAAAHQGQEQEKEAPWEEMGRETSDEHFSSSGFSHSHFTAFFF